MASVEVNKKRRLVSDINVVPYIDVMLVLLIVFMVATPLLRQGVTVDLPQAPSEPIGDSDTEALIVSIKADGLLYIDVGDASETAKPLSDIQDMVSKVLKEQPATDILVWGDTNVAYGEVVSLMTALQNAGAASVGLVTDPPER